MRTALNALTISLITLVCSTAMAQALADGIAVHEPWIRASVPGQTNGAGYAEVKNSRNLPAAIVSVTSDRADKMELHTIVREGGVAKMREVPTIAVPANGSVKLAPGGYHIMFIGLKQPFTAGETIPVTLRFDDGQSATVQFAVRPATYTAPSSQSGGHKH